MRNVLTAAALAAVGALAFTLSHALVESWGRKGGRAKLPVPPRSEGELAAREGAARQCAIYHARFGGQRARLLKIMRADVANYVVIDVAQGRSRVPNTQIAWLRGAFGGADAAWLGEFTSAERALARAADLCPLTMRCRIGEESCGPGAYETGLRAL
jgi:hypothetical protein